MGWKFCSYCGDEMVESRATVPDVYYNVITGAKIETFEVSWCCQRAVRTLAGALDHRSLDPHHDYHVMEMTDCRICGKKHWSREPCPVEKESRKISPEIPPTTEPLHSASARNGSTSDEGVDKVGSTECPECGHQFTPPVSEQRKAYMREYMRERRK